MDGFQTNDGSNGLLLLANAAENLEADLDTLNYQPDVNTSDEETDSYCPVLDTFYDKGGAEAIFLMSNFDAVNFETVWNNVEETLSRTYNVGRLKGSSIKGKDDFL